MPELTTYSRLSDFLERVKLWGIEKTEFCGIVRAAYKALIVCTYGPGKLDFKVGRMKRLVQKLYGWYVLEWSKESGVKSSTPTLELPPGDSYSLKFDVSQI